MTSWVKRVSYIKYLIFVAIMILVFSCDLFDDISGPEEEENIIEKEGYSLLGTKKIGTSGGEINLDSLIINIPSNAFNEESEISIFVAEENDQFDEYGNSALFQISGLPNSINIPISIKIKHHGTTDGDPLIAVGEMKYATSLDNSLYTYHTESATVSAGYLVFDLPVSSGLAKLAQQKNDMESIAINIIALSQYKQILSSAGHFKLSFPILAEQEGVLMGEHFEDAYLKSQTLGFSVSARSKWPVNVLAKILSPNTGGYYSSSYYKNMTDEELVSLINDGNFTINLLILTNSLELRTTAGHEFLHLIQNLYEFSSAEIEPEQNWLKEASAVWIEEKYANIQNYVSSSINNRELYPFDGWQYNGRKYDEHGYGLSVIIKDIAETYGDDAIVKIHEKIKSGTLPSNAVDPVDAVLSVLNEPVGTFWHGVLGSYVLGHYYNNKVNFKFLDKSTSYNETVTIDAQKRTHPLNYVYHDLSGMLFKVKSGDLSTLTTVPLSLKIDDAVNGGILVCKYKQGSEITPIGEVFPGGDGIVLLNDVKQIFADGYELVVMVSNSSHNENANYQSKFNVINLTIEIEEEELEIDWVSVYVWIEDPLGRIRKSWSYNGDWRDLEYRSLSFYHSCSNGSKINNVYSGVFNYDNPNGRKVRGDFQITFGDEYNDPINFHVDEIYTGSDIWDGAWRDLNITTNASNWTENTQIDCNGVRGGWDVTELYPNYKKVRKYELYDRTDSEINVVYTAHGDNINTEDNWDVEYVSHIYDGNPNHIEILVFYK